MYLSSQQETELRSLIEEKGSKGLANTLKFRYPEYLIFLKQQYSFLENPHTLQLCYHFYHDLNDTHKCETCGKPTTFRSFTEGYKRYCKGKCTVNDRTKALVKETFINKYPSEEEHLKFCVENSILRKQSWIKEIEKKNSNLMRHPWKYFKSLEFLADTSMNYDNHVKMIKKYKISCYSEWKDVYKEIMLKEHIRLFSRLDRFKEYSHIEIFSEFYASEEDYLKYKSYKRSVRKATSKTLKVHGAKKFGKDWRKYKKDNNLHVDHIYSVREAFDNDVKISKVSNINNLRLIPAYDNLSKGKRSDMSLDELNTLIKTNHVS